MLVVRDFPDKVLGNMTKPKEKPESPSHLPPRQHNFQDATDKALPLVRAQSDEQLEWLGARATDAGWEVPVLNDTLRIARDDGALSSAGGWRVTPFWQILALHYLSIATQPAEGPTETTFADLPSGRVYAPIYQQRVIGRLCHTAGTDADTLSRAAETIGGSLVEGGDLAFDFRFYPRVGLRLVWYAADEDFPPSATLLLPANIEAFFHIEDVVVLSESLVARLGEAQRRQ